MARSRLYRSRFFQKILVRKLVTRSIRFTCVLRERRTEIENEKMKMYTFLCTSSDSKIQQMVGIDFNHFSISMYFYFHIIVILSTKIAGFFFCNFQRYSCRRLDQFVSEFHRFTRKCCNIPKIGRDLRQKIEDWVRIESG